MARVIALSNQKGGVGKTTTTYELAEAAQRAGLKVLAIDIDPQGNLTSSLAAEELPFDSQGLADVLSEATATTMSEVLTPSLWEGVDLIPTTGEGLAIVRDELIATHIGRESRLKKAIASLGEGAYDLVLIDCPPSIDQLFVNAMVAADQVLVVTHATLFSADGIGHLLSKIQVVREYYNEALTIAGLLINQYEKQLNADQARKRELNQAAEAQGLRVLEPAVPKRTLISQVVEQSRRLDQQSGEDAQMLIKIYDRYIEKLMGES